MRHSIAGFLVAATIAFAGSVLPSSAFAEGGSAYFVDILYLKDGKTPADAKKYFNQVVPVVAGHGLKRITPPFVITKKVSGEIAPNLVNVWSVSDPKNTFANIFKDNNYLQHVALRDATFDMKRSHMFMMKSAE